MSDRKVNFRDNLLYYVGIARPYYLEFLLVISIITASILIEVGQNYIYKIVVDSATELSAKTIGLDAFILGIIFLGTIFLIAVFVQSALRYFRLHFLNRMEVKMMLDIKNDIFVHLLSLSHAFHASHRTGSLISRLIRSSKSIEALTDFFTFHGGPLLIKVIISFFVIAFFDFYSALVVLVMVLSFALFSAFLLRKQQVKNLEKNEAEDYEKAFISDTFTNIETVKHFGKEARLSSLFLKIAKNSMDKDLAFWDYFNFTEAGHVLILGLGTIGVMYFSMLRFLAGDLTIGSVVFIYTSYIGLTLPLYEFFWGVRRFYEGIADLEAVVQYKKTRQDISDAINAKKLKISKGSIEFRGVNFSYGKKKEVIQDFSFKIAPNEKVAFVGPSGAGKTTIIKLLYRFYEPLSGQILIDGKNINEFTQNSLRNELSIVPQECVLFNDSIYNNILFSNPSASKKQVFFALKAAQLFDFVQSLPDKENTVVGERGIKLSGGEKQRLSIARAILADKKILVLDEATSSLDSKTEYEIRAALEKLMKGRTTIIIAHRLSTIMNADKIVVIKKGRIEQIGTHEELAKKEGIYSSLWKLQKTGAIKK